MNDTVSRQAAIDAVSEACAELRGVFGRCEDALNALPSAQPKRMRGKWIKKMRVTETEKYISYDPEWYCSCCGTKYDPHMAKIVNFCYVCGADMRGGEQDG